MVPPKFNENVRNTWFWTYPGGDDLVQKALSIAICNEVLPFYKGLDPNDFKNVMIGRSCFAYLWTDEGLKAVQKPALRRWLVENASFKIGPRTLKEWSQLSLGYDQLDSVATGLKFFVQGIRTNHSPAEFSQYVEHLTSVLESSLRLFVTSKGYFGLADACVEPGDKVCYIERCTLPVLLRVREIDGCKRHSLIGTGNVYFHEARRKDMNSFIMGEFSNPMLTYWRSRLGREYTIEELDLY